MSVPCVHIVVLSPSNCSHLELNPDFYIIIELNFMRTFSFAPLVWLSPHRNEQIKMCQAANACVVQIQLNAEWFAYETTFRHIKIKFNETRAILQFKRVREHSMWRKELFFLLVFGGSCADDVMRCDCDRIVDERHMRMTSTHIRTRNMTKQQRSPCEC